MEQRYRILIVDDDISTREFVVMLLTDEGYVTAQACNGRDALTQIDSFLPHVIMLDLHMPVMDGLTFLQHFRQSGTQASVALMSVSPQLITSAQQYGPFPALQKPCDISDILAAVQRCLPGLV